MTDPLGDKLQELLDRFESGDASSMDELIIYLQGVKDNEKDQIEKGNLGATLLSLVIIKNVVKLGDSLKKENDKIKSEHNNLLARFNELEKKFNAEIARK